MGKFRKKPVEIEAYQWFGQAGVMGFMRWYADLDSGNPNRVDSGFPIDGDEIVITTLEGEMRAGVGDWIIRGIKGEFYPCKPDIFAMTYEPVE